MAEISVVAITVSCTLLLLEAANFNMINPYYGGFFLSLIKKNYKSYRDTLYYLLRDQLTHFGQISDRSVQNVSGKSITKK